MRRLSVGIVGESEDAALISEASAICARRGVVLFVENNRFGRAVVDSAGKVPNLRYAAFDYPQKAPAGGGELEIRVRFPSEVSALEHLCQSADGVLLLGDAPLAEAICRKMGRPLVKAAKSSECLEAASELLNRMLSAAIKQ